MKFENVEVSNFEGAFRGMRNPKASWHLSDSAFGMGSMDAFDNNDMGEKFDNVIDSWIKEVKKDKELDEVERDNLFHDYFTYLWNNGIIKSYKNDLCEYAFLGPKDLDLAKRLIKGGPEHRKFLRQIQVCVNITAPTLWYKEFDTYKIATTANSTSTMHKITSAPINTLERFETDDYCGGIKTKSGIVVADKIKDFLDFLEELREDYLSTNDPKIWKELIRWLPESWLYTRTVTMNYENLRTMVKQRTGHKLTEWAQFIEFVKTLPYADDLIFYEN